MSTEPLVQFREPVASFLTRHNLPLKSATDPKWAHVALADLDAFLLDHASCERKAASVCLALASRYASHSGLIDPLIALAREELEHFAQVHRIIIKRGLKLGSEPRDAYAEKLLRHARDGETTRLLDRLMIASLIEARSAERLQIISEHLADLELKNFYFELARCEAGHWRAFSRMAELYFTQSEIDEATERLASAEAAVISSCPWGSNVH